MNRQIKNTIKDNNIIKTQSQAYPTERDSIDTRSVEY